MYLLQLLVFQALEYEVCASDVLVAPFNYETYLGFNEEATFSIITPPSGVDIAMDSEDAREVGIRAAIVAGFSFVAGYLIKKFWGTQIFRFDTDEYLLGIVDLTVTSPNP